MRFMTTSTNMLLMGALTAMVVSVAAVTGLAAQEGVVTTICEDGKTTVSHPGNRDPQDICTSAGEARAAIRMCGLNLSAEISITMATSPIFGDPACLAAYHCDRDEILLLPLEDIVDLTRDNRLLSQIAEEDLLTSLLIHEFVHAWIARSEHAGNISLIEDEYIAYAMQIAALPSETQAAMRAHSLLPAPPDKRVLSELLLAMDPSRYGLLAWRHFSAAGNGCRFVKGLLAGQANLDLPQLVDHP